MKKIIALALASLMLLGLMGCSKKTDETNTNDSAKADSDYQYIVDKGTMIVGITDYAPMDYKGDDGEWTGFDAEFAKAVADKMGVKVQFVEIDWDNKFIELDSKSIDCIWNGMTISTEVKNNTSCSDAYVKNEQVVVLAKDKADKYTDAASLADLKFAVESGSAGQTAAEDNELSFTAVTAQSDALMEVAAGSVDACIIDSTMAKAMTGDGTSYANLTSSVTLTSEVYGVGFRKDSDMTEKFNSYRKELVSDGTLKTLADKYKLTLAD